MATIISEWPDEKAWALKSERPEFKSHFGQSLAMCAPLSSSGAYSYPRGGKGYEVMSMSPDARPLGLG